MSQFLNDFQAYLTNNGGCMTRVAEQRPDAPVECFQMRDSTPCQNTYSISKTFTATGVGLLVDRGLLTVDETVPSILGDWCPPDYRPEWDKITVHMLLTHSAGLPGGCLDIDVLDANKFSEDYIAEVMRLPLIYEPGQDHRYSDGAFYMLSCIVEKRCGMPLDNLLWKELFRPLGFRDVAWSHCPHGHAMGATGLFTRIEDVVKLGTIYLNEGIYQGQRILSAEWCRMAMERHYGLDPYGDNGSYGKGGMYGQKLLIIPAHNRAVAWQNYASGDIDDIYRFVLNYDKE